MQDFNDVAHLKWASKLAVLHVDIKEEEEEAH